MTHTSPRCLATALLATLAAACSSGGSGSGSVAAGIGGPVLQLPAQLVVEGSQTGLDVGGASASDPDGDALSWSWTIAPSGPFLSGADTSQPSVRFYRNGDYVLTVTVSDGSSSSSGRIPVAVANSEHFTIGGSVERDGRASVAPVDLRWTPPGQSSGAVVLAEESSGGSYAFDQLIGDLLDFEVIVRGW